MPSSGFSTATFVGWATAATIVVLLWAFPPAQLESFPSICLFQQLFDVSCWGCGITRAAGSLLRGEFAEAWGYNWRIYVAAPLLVYAGLRPLTRSDDQPRSP